MMALLCVVTGKLLSIETRHGAGSALCISRGQGTGGPTGRPTPNQPVGAASPMPLHPLHRKLGPHQATPRALGGLKFPPLASLISQLISGAREGAPDVSVCI